MESEELEHIPWSQLIAEQQSTRSRTLFLAAGIVAALVVGIVAARAFANPVPAASAVTGTTTTSISSTVPATTAPTGLAPSLYSEADLMALVPEEEARAAVARAEWFVTDYFTADLEPQGSAPIRAALPPGASLPALPQDTEMERVSYVEWARATRVETLDASLYRVTVAYRVLGAVPEGAFRRLPVRAVDVVVRTTPEGAAIAVDIPSPVDLATTTAAVPWPDLPSEAPPLVTDSAIRHAGTWGDNPAVTAVSATTAGWRITLEVSDPVGIRWPLVVWLDTAGNLLASPPWEG